MTKGSKNMSYKKVFLWLNLAGSVGKICIWFKHMFNFKDNLPILKTNLR